MAAQKISGSPFKIKVEKEKPAGRLAFRID